MSDTEARNSRKVRVGVVTSISGAKSITVKIDNRKRHPKYGKMITVTKKLHAHDENEVAHVGGRQVTAKAIFQPMCAAREGAPLGWMSF